MMTVKLDIELAELPDGALLQGMFKMQRKTFKVMSSPMAVRTGDNKGMMADVIYLLDADEGIMCLPSAVIELCGGTLFILDNPLYVHKEKKA